MLALFALLLAAPPADLKAQGEAGLRAIRAEALSAHIRFLADDLLEGRGTGTRGHAIAARYLATQLQALGFEPAGEKGTWFQQVPFVGMTVQPKESALEIDGAAWKYPDEMIFYPRAGSPGDDVSGELVFAGCGVSAPQYGYDDVPSDLRGKIAVIIYGAPRSERESFFPTAASAAYSDSYAKSRLLKERGAVGMIVVMTPQILQHNPWPFAVRQVAFEQMAWLAGDQPGNGYALPAARVPDTALQRLLAKSGGNAQQLFQDAVAGKLKPFPLGMRARLRVSAAVRTFASENAAGVLRGGVRANEYVATTAHLDHLGIGPPIDGDSIYNGAQDDAAGVSGIIEIARAFAALPRRPARSILVVGMTGEEKGLQGSDFFAQHPTVPIGSIVADVNLDSPQAFWEPHDLRALGAEHSTLLAAVQAAAQAQGLKISPDPEPEQVFFIRADQFSFVKQGVPAVFPGSGWQDAQGNIEKNKAYADWWTKNRYHMPTDEWDPKLDYENMAKEVRAEFLIALAVALDPERPRWNEGDVFGKLFTRRETASPTGARGAPR
jgi:hypothetical protein